MVAQNDRSANLDLSWEALTGKHALLGSQGIGRHVACWIAEELGYVVISMVPIPEDNSKRPFETWGDEKPGRSAGVASSYRTPLEIMRAKYFRLRCGVGILAGKSGLVCIDIDNDDSWDQFVAGRDMPRTTELSTRYGRHLIFRDETGISFKTQSSQLAIGVDVRGRGGLFVVYDPGQPERHFTDLTEPAELPDWLREAIPRAGTRGRRRAAGERSRVSAADIKKLSSFVIPPGGHHEWLRATSLSLANKGWTKASRNDWFMIASAALKRSNEGSDAKGNADREHFSDEDIMGFFDSALDKKADEDSEERTDPGKKYRGADLIINAADVPDEDVEWVWSRYIPRCALTQLDGEKGYGKSFTLADIIARATLGRAMPGEEEAICEPMNVFMFTEEVMAQNKKKLRAAGADLSRVSYPSPGFRESIIRLNAENWGTEEYDDSDLDVLLPTGIDLILEMIRQAEAELVIWDPITNYVDVDKMNTNSDPAVRRALEPLVLGLDRMNAAGIMVRHMNKDVRASARMRGLGSTAFQNIGRVHLVMGKLPDVHSDLGTYGLGMQSNNYTPVVPGAIVFDVVDSDIKLDNLGNMVGKIEWHDIEEDIDTDTLVRGNDGRSEKGTAGPVPNKRTEVKRILGEMNEIRQEWDSIEARQYIKDEMEKRGFEGVNDRTIDKALRESLISSVKQPDSSNHWIWPAQKVPRAHARARSQTQ